MRLINIVLLSSLLIFSYSCNDEKYIVDEVLEIPNEEWLKDDKIDFGYEISDTTSVYEMLLDVEHHKDYPYENLYVNIQTEFPNMKITNDILSLELMNSYGYSHGDCNGDYCHVPIDLLSNVKFLDTGHYKISFNQYSRRDTLQGVKSLRFRLGKIKD